ncbi:acyl-CoA dehydrogenase family protein [Desulfobacula sp.]|uniref:acyl-CoA dehydrogenase family protein n=3 Tax=Desulfobacula sp. TaxID=2593537 RepID=UPI001EC10981|nr:acyl-CoA dehydrogenase [Desulfobacula sp.]MBT3486675.1 acyl-CoA dehydrogenase [Desulfobacula sp.]MBT4200482.1 acyl-CoA dehydrogenase [Desulfobacula sp.]MBT7630041.1 acyl-CoA dehydrogenase [Desulfobacula sp.]MBT7793009.1 acyl-CoA dehydrogenase [Desulfobacula sp.]
MDFLLTKEQKYIQKAAREFAMGEMAPVGREFDLNETYPAAIVKKARGLDLIGLFIPEKFGGPGLGYLEQAMVMEEFWKVDPGISQQLCSLTFGAEEFLLFGTDEQGKKFLEPIFTGDAVMGFAITEPDAGSDTLAASTTAVKEGNEWVLNGSKVMIGNGTRGTFMLIFALTDPDAARSKRHSIIIVETDREGYKADPMHGKMGLRASDTAAIYLNNVRVPEENLLGTRGNGFHQLMAFFDRSRAYVSAHGVGLAQGALNMAVKHVRERKQFGKPIGSFQGVQFKIADMAVKIELARNIMYKAAWLLDNGKADTNVTAMAKMYAARIAVEVVDEALQLHGGYGYFDDYDIERFYRAAKVLEIYEGAKEIEKMIIGRTIVGR